MPLILSTVVFTGIYVSISWSRDYLPRMGRKSAAQSPIEVPVAATAVIAARPVEVPGPTGRHRRVTDEVPTGRFSALAAPGPRHNGVAVGTHRGKPLPRCNEWLT